MANLPPRPPEHWYGQPRLVPVAPVTPITPAAPIAPAAPPAAVPPVAPAVIDDFDEEFEATVVIARGHAMTDWYLVDIDGTRFRLATSNVLGRRPTSGPAGAQFIALSDSERVLSRMHALIEVENDELWITDLKSTNGTEILGHEQQVTPCEALRRYPLGADLAVSLGGRPVTFLGPCSR